MAKSFKPLGLILLVGAIIGVVCLVSVFGGIRNLFGGGQDLLGGGSETGELGRLYTAAEVDQNGCPEQPASEFLNDETVFVGVEESEIPGGTSMFVRLYHEGQPVEDTDPVEADRDLRSCVWFQFEPTGQSGFEPGDYEAELYVNGNRVDSVRFQVADSGSEVGSIPNTGVGGAELGQMFTASEIDENGCPLNDVSEFFPEEPVYVSLDESFVPEGTERFARLVYEGQPIEDTDPLVADRDLETCIWFEFQGSGSSGLEPGEYAAEVYVDGNLADSARFIVR